MRNDDFDDAPDRDDDGPAYPLTVTLAGVAWIRFGGLFLVNLMIFLVILGGAGGRGGSQAAGAAAGGTCGAVVMGLFAAAFMH